MTRTPSLVIALCLVRASVLTGQQIPVPFPLKVLEQSVAQDSNNAGTHYAMALAYWNEKRYDEAERALRLSMMLDPQYAEPHLAAAFLPYARRPKLWEEVLDNKIPEQSKAAMEESDREYRRAFLLNPFVDIRIMGAVIPRDESFWRFQNPQAYQLFLKPYDDLLAGRYTSAYQGFDRLEREWGFATHRALPRRVYWFKALCAARIGKVDQAITALDHLLQEQEKYERDNRDKLIHTDLGTNEYRYIKAILLQAQDKKEAALAMYRTVLEHDIGLYMAHVRMAAIYEGTEQWAEALRERQRAVDANPDDPSLLIDLGATAAQAGRLDLALPALARAAGANPRLADSYFWIGLIQQGQGNRDKAEQALLMFLATAPSSSRDKINVANERLAQLAEADAGKNQKGD